MAEYSNTFATAHHHIHSKCARQWSLESIDCKSSTITFQLPFDGAPISHLAHADMIYSAIPFCAHILGMHVGSLDNPAGCHSRTSTTTHLGKSTHELSSVYYHIWPALLVSHLLCSIIYRSAVALQTLSRPWLAYISIYTLRSHPSTLAYSPSLLHIPFWILHNHTHWLNCFTALSIPLAHKLLLSHLATGFYRENCVTLLLYINLLEAWNVFALAYIENSLFSITAFIMGIKFPTPDENTPSTSAQ